MKQRILTIGDIHGRYDALRKILKQAKYNDKRDKLIVLGDIVDGGHQTKQVIEYLRRLKNLVFVRGNHDQFFIDFLLIGSTPNMWLHQGGAYTITSYYNKINPTMLEQGKFIDDSKFDLSFIKIPTTHKKFVLSSVPYHIENDMAFVHGGFKIGEPLNKQTNASLMWNRDIISYAQTQGSIPNYRKVFIGHTTTQYINNVTQPIKINNLYLMDCGAGWDGRLALMDIETEETWTSELLIPASRVYTSKIRY